MLQTVLVFTEIAGPHADNAPVAQQAVRNCSSAMLERGQDPWGMSKGHTCCDVVRNGPLVCLIPLPCCVCHICVATA